MQETLITIHKSDKLQKGCIGYGVFPRVDKLSEGEKQELARTLDELKKKLLRNQYPFRR